MKSWCRCFGCNCKSKKIKSVMLRYVVSDGRWDTLIGGLSVNLSVGFNFIPINVSWSVCYGSIFWWIS